MGREDYVGKALDDLLEILDIEEIDENIFRGQNEKTRWGRLFGGQVAAQSLVAAGRTVEDRAPHSLHSYVLRPGDPKVPVVFTVDRIRDGSSFTTRRVVAQQRGKAIFNASVSFHKVEEGFTHSDDAPEAPDPESLPTWQERARQAGDKVPKEARSWLEAERAIDQRSTRGMALFGDREGEGSSLIWMKTNGALPDDLFLHQCLLTYASDMSLLENMIHRHVKGFSFGRVMMASLDHALWFHRPFRMDEWLLYAQDSPAAEGARGFVLGSIYSKGERVTSVAQEGLMRPIAKPKSGKEG
jgi:acyl-CoA thioesterase-2